MLIPAPVRAQEGATDVHRNTEHDEHTSFLTPLTHQMGTKHQSKDLFPATADLPLSLSSDVALVLQDIVPLTEIKTNPRNVFWEFERSTPVALPNSSSGQHFPLWSC